MTTCPHLSALDELDGLRCLNRDCHERRVDRAIGVLLDGTNPQPRVRSAVLFLLVLLLGGLAGLVFIHAAQPALCALNGQQAHSYCPGFTQEQP